MNSIRTDLTIEAAELCGGVDGIEGCNVEEVEYKGVKVTTVDILTDGAAQKIGKPVGRYITLQSKAIRTGESQEYEAITQLLQRHISDLTKGKSNVLIVGLGNRSITPDALGPKAAEQISVTRHLTEQKIITNAHVPVISAIAPGVLGVTGIETGEIIKGVVDKTRPDIIIAIDALAAHSMERVTTTIQLSDTGIIPGSGVGNRRNALTEETLGVPVVAVGVPTVVDAAAVANDSLDMLALAAKENAGEDSQLYKSIKNLENENRLTLIKHVLNPFVGSLIVTPTEIDSIIDHVSMIIAEGINLALVGNI
ncbi:MAG: GPR endopeptidase [Clostridia bacterium]|nr:GPR endopeptidase [Clostridia bacterium]